MVGLHNTSHTIDKIYRTPSIYEKKQQLTINGYLRVKHVSKENSKSILFKSFFSCRKLEVNKFLNVEMF